MTESTNVSLANKFGLFAGKTWAEIGITINGNDRRRLTKIWRQADKRFPIQSSPFPHCYQAVAQCAAANNRPPSEILTTKQSTPPLDDGATLCFPRAVR